MALLAGRLLGQDVVPPVAPNQERNNRLLDLARHLLRDQQTRQQLHENNNNTKIQS